MEYDFDEVRPKLLFDLDLTPDSTPVVEFSLTRDRPGISSSKFRQPNKRISSLPVTAAGFVLNGPVGFVFLLISETIWDGNGNETDDPPKHKHNVQITLENFQAQTYRWYRRFWESRYAN